MAIFHFRNGDEIKQGATFSKLLTLKNSDGTARDLTGCTFRMQLRTSLQETPALELTTANSGLVIVSAVAGTLRVDITATQTALLAYGQYAYDLETGNGASVERTLQGWAQVTANVTR